MSRLFSLIHTPGSVDHHPEASIKERKKMRLKPKAQSSILLTSSSFAEQGWTKKQLLAVKGRLKS
jgi:hypothetical protein